MIGNGQRRHKAGVGTHGAHLAAHPPDFTRGEWFARKYHPLLIVRGALDAFRVVGFLPWYA